jgi:FKBP-type peptidyl-prolyl cis-trans isomerase
MPPDHPSHTPSLFSYRSVAPRPSKQLQLTCRASNRQNLDSSPPPPSPSSTPRRMFSAATFLALPAALFASITTPSAAEAAVKGYEPMPALQGKDYGKTRMTYSDYVTTDSGLQYQDLKPGTGAQPSTGQTAVVDWSGVTIGYYGRPFEARNKPKGGAFTGDEKDFFRFKLGDPGVIPAFNEAVAGMKVGGIRRIIVPSEIGYPENDYKKGQPSPTTFSGKRALGFVLENQGFIDKTLLFDIELLKVVE